MLAIICGQKYKKNWYPPTKLTKNLIQDYVMGVDGHHSHPLEGETDTN